MHDELLDLDLLRIFKSRKNYEKYAQFIDSSLLSQEVNIILKGYEEYYKVHEGDIKFSTFVPWFINTLHRNWLPDEVKYYKMICKHVIEIPARDLEATLLGFKEKKLWHDLEKAKESDFDTATMEELIISYNKNLNQTTNTIKYITLDEALSDDVLANCLHWALPSTEYYWGPIKSGQFYLIAATTHTGKSSFVINEACNIVKQLDGKNLLYFNNERSERSIYERFLCTLFKKPLESIHKNKDKVRSLFLKKYPNEPIKIFSARNDGKSRKEIETACAAHNPGAIIIDQIDKLLFKSETSLRRPYEGVYAWARNLAVKYDVPVFGVTQYGVKKDQQGNEIMDSKMTQHGTFDATIDKASNTDFLLGIQNVQNNDRLKRIYLIRAKEGEEGVQFICNFNKQTGVYYE